jgi:hypothetical protein
LVFDLVDDAKDVSSAVLGIGLGGKLPRAAIVPGAFQHASVPGFE